MSDIDTISVIIPIYNRKRELKKAIESVLNQTYQQFEILVVDDFSNDNPEETINYFNDSRISYIRLQQKSNGNVARNAGIMAATGKFIAMLDSDDEWLPEHLERKLNYIRETDTDGVFGSVKIFKGEKFRIKVSRSFKSGEKMVNYLLDGGFAQTSSHFYKTEMIKNVMYDESLHRHQDWDLCVRFSEKYKFIPDIQVTAIINWLPTQIKNVHYASQQKYIEQYKKEILPSLYAKYHIIMYLKVIRSKAPKEIIEHYKKNSLKYIKNTKLVDFMTFKQPKTIFTKALARAEFIIRRFI